uniref:60S acidic ribosomal protein P2 n=1 Tax=Peronospora matthiolae TaxID=2874970 RepID=A0AAV1U8L4_9STRA
MRYIAAYLLAVLGGQPSPTENEVTRILNASGVEVDAKRVAAVVKAMEGKNIDEVIAAGSEKLAVFGSAGPAPAAGGAAASGAETARVEEKVVEEEEEVDMGGGMDMFGAGDEDY